MPDNLSPEIDFSGLRRVAIADRGLFEEKLSILDRRSCECSFANILLWSEPYEIDFVPWDGRLLLVEREIGSIHFPIGAYPAPAALAAAVRAGLAAGVLKNGNVYDAPEDYFARFPDAAAHFEAEFDEDNFDYLYNLEHLVRMDGPLLRKKRNLVRQFERLYPENRLIDITPDNLHLAVDLAHELNHKLIHADFLDAEDITLGAAERYFAELDLGGVILATNGRAVGLSIYSKLNSDTYDIHFEKVDHSVKGAPQTLVARLAARLLERGGTYQNREQDMGEPGLRQAKRSLDPCLYEKRSLLKLRELS